MQILRLNNFGFNGINSDLDSASIDESLFSIASNFRCLDDKVITLGGRLQITSAYTDTLPVNGTMFVVNIGPSVYYFLLNSKSVHVFDGSVWYDVSPVGLSTNPVDEFKWTATMLGNIPVFNNPGFTPVYWSPQNTSQILLPLIFDNSPSSTWLASGKYAQSFRAHRNFLFALNLNEGGIDYPYSYRWSHPADTNGLPPSWDDTDLSFIASKESLAGSGGNIVDGRSIRESFCIYSKGSITILDYVGGEFIWQARQLSSSFGLLGVNMCAEFLGMNALISDSDFVINDGNSIKSILSRKLRRRFASALNDELYSRCSVTHIPSKNEVWFCVIEEGYTYPNIAYIYNYNTDTISLRDLPGITNIAYGPLKAIDDSYDSSADASLSMDSDYSQSNKGDYYPFNFRAVGFIPSDGIYSLEDNSSYSYNTVLERTNFVFNGLDGASTILAMYPKLVSTGLVTLQVGSQQHYDGPVSWKQYIQFNPNTDRRIPIRSTGKLHAWKISSVNNTPFSMSGMDIEYKSAGAR